MKSSKNDIKPASAMQRRILRQRFNSRIGILTKLEARVLLYVISLTKGGAR